MKRNKYGVLLLLCLLLPALLMGCAGRKTPTPEEFTAKAEAAGFPMEDLLSVQGLETSFETAFIYRDEETDTEIDYAVAADAATAQSLYARLLDQFSGAGLEEKRIDSSEYNRFFAEGNGTVTLLWRNGTTMIFVTGEDSEALRGFLDDLGL